MFQLMRILHGSRSMGHLRAMLKSSTYNWVREGSGGLAKHILSVPLGETEAYSAPIGIDRRSLLEKLVHGFCGV